MIWRKDAWALTLALVFLAEMGRPSWAFVPSNRAFHHHPAQHHDRTATVATDRATSFVSRLPFPLEASSSSSSSVTLSTELTDDKVTQLFAWVSRAFAGDDDYNNLMLAIAVIFGDLGSTPQGNSAPAKMAQQMKERALEQLRDEEDLMGEAFSTDDREIASLGAMGAAQWTGQFKTRPHALLDVSNLTCAQDWVSTLPRGCKRTLKRAVALAEQGNFTVTHKPIVGRQPAPHSSLAHFRCVIAHEVRLLTYDETDVQGFLDALAEGVSRYMGTTRMAGDIYEYRSDDGNVIAIAHEVRKGKVIRGQWFYANDYASQNYVWFHSVYSLVERSIQAGSDNVQVVDLGPSGSDSFSQLKSKYGFQSVDDWTRLADYTGPFYYVNGTRPVDGTNRPARYEQQLQDQARFGRFF
eukprot:CAMPEP_0172471324 /NCGR_PEP_ID=MMETSP1065-20121228/67758_1 /TAXON_ID=265537 /ORGANISM="Amphiprora paludosa, Strain CCMP125" /LENGTH=409 /DNA_ID=CAMNT_0013229419 /DNA_START=1613 /DNA_END=2842 /DNA_ORIENTATION=+